MIDRCKDIRHIFLKYRTEEKDGCTAAGGFYQGGHSLDHCSGIYFIIYQ